MKDFVKQFASIDERKTSTIIFGFLVMLVLGVWGYHKTLTFDPTIANVLVWFAGIIGGVNGLTGIASMITSPVTPQRTQVNTNSTQNTSMEG